MKKRFVAGLVVLVAGIVSANPAKEKMFARVDVDKDGKASKVEYLALFEESFKNMDKNKDGALDGTEFKHPAFKHIDTNKDAKIDPAENKAFREKTFGQLDADKDGWLSKEEFIK
ncbi:EF-hand domain-containing protein [Pontiella sp.]|uniref:EF-hand domain-containing protein n=1 Tax=Pontiella sp. TaxID=2837462 RepID=UPI0035618C39